MPPKWQVCYLISSSFGLANAEFIIIIVETIPKAFDITKNGSTYITMLLKRLATLTVDSFETVVNEAETIIKKIVTARPKVVPIAIMIALMSLVDLIKKVETISNMPPSKPMKSNTNGITTEICE